MDTAVYIGAGTNIIPILKFRNIGTFIYVDLCKSPWLFYNYLLKLGFRKMIDRQVNVWEFTHLIKGTTILYYSECNFPLITEALSDEIKQASILICCGHVPDSKILDLMKPGPKQFIGDNKTIYKYHDINSVSNTLLTNPHTMTEYYKINIPKGYPYWEEFYVEESHASRFPITTYSSLQDFIGY